MISPKRHPGIGRGVSKPGSVSAPQSRGSRGGNKGNIDGSKESEPARGMRFVGLEVRSPCAPLRRARCAKCLHTAMGYLYNRNESRPGVLLPRRICPESAPKAANPMGLQVAARLTWSNQRFEQVTSWLLVSCGASCNPQRIAEKHPSKLTNSAQRACSNSSFPSMLPFVTSNGIRFSRIGKSRCLETSAPDVG